MIKRRSDHEIFKIQLMLDRFQIKFVPGVLSDLLTRDE